MLRVEIRAGEKEVVVETDAELLQEQRLELIREMLDAKQESSITTEVKEALRSGALDKELASAVRRANMINEPDLRIRRRSRVDANGGGHL